MMRKSRRPKKRRIRRPRTVALPEEFGDTEAIVQMLREMIGYGETSPALSGGDLDADWLRAHLSGEEAVGGSVATPDQDVVDEIGRALGVEQPADTEVRTSSEILRERDRYRWRMEREAADAEE